jgi:hypothetical protein
MRRAIDEETAFGSNRRANACWTISSASSDHGSSSAGRITTNPTKVSPSLFYTRKNNSKTNLNSNNMMKLRRSMKHSTQLRSLLKSDLRMRSKSPPLHGSRLAGERRASPNRQRKLDEYQHDIDQLLTSLQSTQFVGTIDPKYHSKYLSTPSF